MIDFHTHILPGIDDGSKNIKESLELLKMLASQNVDTVIATPHYSIRAQSDTEFLHNRGEALKQLLSNAHDNIPKIVLGAEVEYFSGISRSKFISDLRIEGTDFLLLEMPFEKWRESVVSEVMQLCRIDGIIPVFAHIERYFRFADFKTLCDFSENGVCFQINCSSLIDGVTRRKTLKLLENDMVQFVGTDCHYLPGRFPDMDSFVDFVNKKIGNKFLTEFFNNENLLLKNILIQKG